MRIQIPGDVEGIIRTLEEAGYEAYAVGGCVRDTLLGRTPGDWDITTSALPDQVKQLFRRTVDTGIAHGTVTVLVNRVGYEVTTFRIDGEYEDARHPKEVVFTPKLSEDLKRRDFTINAMAYNHRTGIVDLFRGREDLEKGVIRCVGDAKTRFEEDALRIMRAVRFSAQLGFAIEDGTRRAASAMARNLERVSQERIQAELVKLLVSAHPERMRELYQMGITRVILPEFDVLMETPQNNPHHCLNVGEHTLKSLCGIAPDKVLRLTMLLHDMGKPACRTTDGEGLDHFKGHGEVSARMAGNILRRLKLDNDTIRKVTLLVRYHDWRMEPQERTVRRAMHRIGTELFPSLLQVQTADTLAQSTLWREQKLERIRDVAKLCGTILQENQCVSLKDLAVTGKDLMALGMKPGPEIGSLLKQALEHVLDFPEDNTKEYLTEFCQRRI